MNDQFDHFHFMYRFAVHDGFPWVLKKASKERNTCIRSIQYVEQYTVDAPRQRQIGIGICGDNAAQQWQVVVVQEDPHLSFWQLYRTYEITVLTVKDKKRYLMLAISEKSC